MEEAIRLHLVPVVRRYPRHEPAPAQRVRWLLKRAKALGLRVVKVEGLPPEPKPADPLCDGPGCQACRAAWE